MPQFLCEEYLPVSETTASPLRALLRAGTVLGALPALSGCILAAAGAGAAGGYATLAQERSASDQLKDTSIRALVSKSWDEYSPDMPHNLDAIVYEGRVLITGRLANDQLRQEAVQRTWKVDGVKEVYNEIEVGPETHFSDEARDTVISTRLKNDLVWDSQVKSINYTVKTEDGVVYIIGSARTRDEMDRVTGYARNIPNVRRVVSYVRVRPGDPSAVQAGSGPVAAPSPAPVTAPTAVNTAPTALTAPADAPVQRSTIDVTPLR
jgi:osmotically-inducible protein OsmY